MSQWGGEVYTRFVVAYTWTWASLGFPNGVSAHGIEELVKGGRLRGQMQKLKGQELAAQFPPQGCGPALPPEVGVAGGAAEVHLDHIRGGFEGCCPAQDIIHPPTSSTPSASDWYVASSN